MILTLCKPDYDRDLVRGPNPLLSERMKIIRTLLVASRWRGAAPFASEDHCGRVVRGPYLSLGRSWDGRTVHFTAHPFWTLHELLAERFANLDKIPGSGFFDGEIPLEQIGKLADVLLEVGAIVG